MAATTVAISQLPPSAPPGDVMPAVVAELAPAEPGARSSSQAVAEDGVGANADRAADSSAPGDSAPGSSAPGSSAPGSAAPGSSAPGSSAPGSAVPAGVSGQVAAAALADGSEIVFGVPIEDNGIAKVMRRVIVLAAVCATFYVTHFIGNLMRGAYSSPSSGDSSSLWTAISSLLIELSIPACGYYGALHSNRQLTCCFCSCNLFVTIVSIMSFVRLNIRIGEIDGACERERNSHSRRTCEVWTSDGTEKYLMISSTVLVMCLGCLAFWFGNSLYQRLAQEFTSSGVSHVTLVGEVISLSSLQGTLVGATPGTLGPIGGLPGATGAPRAPGAPAAAEAPAAGSTGTANQAVAMEVPNAAGLPVQAGAEENASHDGPLEPPQPATVPPTALQATVESAQASNAMPGVSAEPRDQNGRQL